jgi:putative membrane protein
MLNALTAQQFVTDAAVGGMKEVSLGRLALANSQNAEVKTFANRMIQDHSAANARLEQIARNEGLDLPATNMFAPEDANWSNPALTGSQEVKGAYLLTTNLPVADYQDFKQLKSLSGKEFDVAYAKAAVNDHINTVREFELAQRLVSDPQLNQFAASTLPTIRMHLQMARRLENELVGAPTAGTEPNQAMPAGQPLSSAGGM